MSIQVNALNQSIFLLADPTAWACRYSSRPTIASPIFAEFSQDGQVRLLDISGGVDPDWTTQKQTGVTKSDTMELETSVWEGAAKLLSDFGPGSALSALAKYMAARSDEWESFSEEIESDRFEASAWFERDRASLVLTDNLTGQDIVSLWDESVTQAIEDGFLERPRTHRPSDSDWVEPLRAYAQSQGLLTTEKLITRPSAPRPITA